MLRQLLPLYCIIIFGTMGSILLKAVFPFVVEHISSTGVALGAVSSGFMLGKMVGSPILGYAADRFGKKRAIIISQMGCVAGLIMTANANTIQGLVIARTVGGFFAATVTISYAHVSQLVPAKQRATEIARLTAALSAAMMVGGYSGHHLVAALGFQMTVYVGACMSGVAILVAAIFLRDVPKAPAPKETTEAASTEPRPTPHRRSISRGAIVILAHNVMIMALRSMLGQLTALMLRSPQIDTPDAQALNARSTLITGAIKIALQASPFIGMIYGVVGEVRSLTVCCGILAAVFMALPRVSTPVQFLTLAVTDALPSALLAPAANSLLSQCAAGGQQGRLGGINSSLQAFGGVVAPVAIGHLYDILGLERSAYVGVASCVAAGLFVVALIPCKPCAAKADAKEETVEADGKKDE